MTDRSVLVADDSRVFRAWVAELLRNRGFKVIEADNGRSALQMALDHRPGLLLLDALMPALTGLEVITKLHEKAPAYQPVLFLVTAVYRSRRFESEALRTHNVDEYLEKPLEEPRLDEALARHRARISPVPDAPAT
jgi:CheY-like chemotaxis protein